MYPTPRLALNSASPGETTSLLYLRQTGAVDGACLRSPTCSGKCQKKKGMNTFFLLLDMTTGNMVTEFDSEDEVIEILSDVQARNGDESLLEYALFRYEDDRPRLVAREHDLVHYLARSRERIANPVVGAGT